jgi:hypothetical protein
LNATTSRILCEYPGSENLAQADNVEIEATNSQTFGAWRNAVDNYWAENKINEGTTTATTKQRETGHEKYIF